MAKRDLQDRLASLEALIDAQSEGPEAALKRLAGLVDPESLRRRLALLRQLNRIDEAYLLVANRPVEAEWLEQGTRVAVLANDVDLARHLVIAARTLEDDTGTLALRSAAAFIEGALERHVHSISAGHGVFRYAVRPEDRRALENADDLISEFGDAIIRRRNIASRLEREAMTSLLLARGLLHKPADDLAPLLSLLVRHKPVDPELGQFCLDGRLPQVPHLSEAILESHPEDFLGQFVGIILQAEIGNDWSAAFHRLTALKPIAVSEGERETLFASLSQVARKIGGPATSETDALRTTLLDMQIPRHRLAAADHEARFGRWQAAEELLARGAVVQGPYARWIQAQCALARDHTEDAITHLVAAALEFLHDGWLMDAAQRANAAGRTTESILCLERLREYYPTLLGPRKSLALQLWGAGRHEESIGELLALTDLLPQDDSIRVQLAREYLHINEPQSAIDALSGLQEVGHSGVAALVLLAVALTRTGKVREAFTALDQYRNKFWKDKDFLFAYMESAYAAGHEREAGLALQALNGLREGGLIDPKQFRVGSLDEILELTRKTQERREHANRAIISCQMPWTTCAEAFGRPLIWDWMLRTQEARWITEDPQSRSEYSIYATNGFAVAELEGEKRLTKIEAGEADTISADYSALITLHHLGKLPMLFSAYRTVIVPAEYRFSVLEDDRRLRPHQLSQRESSETIADYLTVAKIRVATSAEAAALLKVDEYVDDTVGRPIIRLRALIDSLARAGRVDKVTETRLRTLPLRPQTEKRVIQPGDSVLISALTLRTLYRERLLEPVVDMFRVSISTTDRDEILGESRAFRFQETTRQNLEELWRTVERERNVEFVSQKRIEKDEDEDNGMSLFAFRLAVARNVPLLVDDRTLQAVVTNQRGSARDTAFASIDLLEQLHSRGALDIEEYARCLIQLVRWRYKFIVPSAEVLHHFAARYSGGVPGQELALIARYVHESMSDPGLLGGLENSTPPTSMALKLYITWHSRIGEFLGRVWTSAEIPAARSEAVTDWVAQAMLPSAPISIDERFHAPMARQVREITIANALIQTGQAKPNDAAPLLLRRFAEALGVSQRRLWQLSVEVIDRVVH